MFFVINHDEFGHILIQYWYIYFPCKGEKKDFYKMRMVDSAKYRLVKFGLWNLVIEPSLPYTIILQVLESRIPK